MRTVALLGGMTYQASALYYTTINDYVRQKLGGRYCASIILHSFNFHPILDAMNGGRWDVVSAHFLHAATHMKAAGADALVICANYPHKIADEVEGKCGLPLLHIADFVGREIASSGKRTAGLLGTKMVMEEGYIKDRITRKFGVEVIVPDEQGVRNEIHAEFMENLPSGKVSEEFRALLRREAQALVDRGAEGLILGSTDLAFAISADDVGVPLFDTNALHARGVAEWMLVDDTSNTESL